MIFNFDWLRLTGLRSSRSVLAWVLVLNLFAITAPGAVTMPGSWSGDWSSVGRADIQSTAGSVIINGGFAVEKRVWDDAELTFRARAPLGTEQVQIWGGFRYRDRDSRYVFALRGGNDNDLYLARYAPDGGAEFLGFAPLDFKPVPGTWYRLRVVTLGKQIQIFLNDEKLPRLTAEDPDAKWDRGGVALGGGWLPAEFADVQVKELTATDKSAFLAIGDQRWAAPPVDKEAERKEQRAAYATVKIASLDPLRTEVSLDGNWLFLPDYQMAGGPAPVPLGYDDQNWHVMQVPCFWTPGLSWLHGETGFNELPGLSSTKAVAESLYVQENRRCDSYTFDWHKTRAAWYRQYIDLPASATNKHFELSFDAIAKVSEVWVNGTRVGGHTGMFGEVKCDVTGVIRPGRNVIAVHVTGQPGPDDATNKVEGVAVTVEVTSAMLNSLPHGMFQDNAGGIWQPVKLTATAPVLVSGCFIEPGLHGADIHLDVLNTTTQPAGIDIDYTITSVRDGAVLYSGEVPQSSLIAAAETGHVKFATPHLEPKLWSPQDPNLYHLEVRLKDHDKAIDDYQVEFGFRTFTVDGDRFILNGKPYWLRGGNPFPNTLRPNDGTLARRFIEIAREGNVNVTRSHIVPFTQTWLKAADEGGMAVSFEGTWPWLMLSGETPDEKLLKIWKDEFLSLIQKNRNHPSIVLWTVNNEMNFEDFDRDNLPLMKKKWLVLDDAIKAMHQADPTRPVVPDSGYTRMGAAKGYASVVKPEGFDDGDVDDAHRYYGWYNESFFHMYDGQFVKQLGTPGRPLISQEMSTGYPNNDDGHATRFYLFKHHTPQALVGDHAYEDADPAIFLQRQAFMTKELAETLRRTAHESGAGVLFFSYFTWFQSPWSVKQIKPWPTYYALKTALQPVLVSAELYGRHFYADSTVHRRVCLINDALDGQAIPGSRLTWEFRSGDKVLSSGRVEVSSVDYYQNRWLDVDFKTPAELPSPRVDGQLVLRLEADGKVLSENNYDVVLATGDWAKGNVDEKSNISLWNPGGDLAGIPTGVEITAAKSIDEANPANVLVIGNLEKNPLTQEQMAQLKSFVSGGGRVLMLHPGSSLTKLFPEEVKNYTPKQGEIVTMHIPESPVFSGIEPLDLAWFDRGDRRLPLACTGVYRMAGSNEDTSLASQCNIHGYLKKTSDVMDISGSPLVEIRLGKGRVLASELFFEADKNDPIAHRVLMNAVRYLQD